MRNIENLITTIEKSDMYEDFEKHKLIFMLQYVKVILKKERKSKAKLTSIIEDLIISIEDIVIHNKKIDRKLFGLFRSIENLATKTGIISSITSEVFNADELLDEKEKKWILQGVEK